MQNATFLTLNVDTGPDGDVDPQRPLATLEKVSTKRGSTDGVAQLEMPAVSGAPGPQRFEGLADAKPTAQRTLYFSETVVDDRNPTFWLNTEFFITVDGATPQIFNPDNPPAITTTQGSVEDWTIQNLTREGHEFHMHQIHFKILEVDGKPVADQDLRDTFEIPFWEGPGHPYHSIKVRMDFRDPTIAGTFVFHCHILLHEDLGMMHKILVLPK